MYTYYLLVLLHTYSVINEKKSALKILHSFLKVYNPIYTPRTLVVKLGYDDAASKNISLSYRIKVFVLMQSDPAAAAESG